VAFTHVQGVSQELQLSGSSTVANTYGSATAVDNALTATVTWYGGGTASTCTVSDSEGTTWIAGTRVASGDTSTFYQQAFYAFATTTGTPTVTATFSAGSPSSRALLLDEFNESGGKPVFDTEAANNQASPGTGTDAITSGSMTIAQSGSLVYGFMQLFNGTNNGSAGTGFTLTGTQLTFSATPYGYSEHKLNQASGTQAATFTTSVNQQTFCSGLVFSPPAAGGSIVVLRRRIEA